MTMLLLLLLLCPPPATATARCTTTTPFKTYSKCTPLPTQDATIAWTYHPHNATLDIAFSGTFISPSGWVAWGINPTSPEMTGTRALMAFSDPTTGALTLLPYLLDSTIKLQHSPLTSRHLDIPLLASSAVATAVHDGAAVHIHATIKLRPNRTLIHHVWNRGLYVQGYSPTIHPTSNADLASRATFDIVAGGSGAAAAAAAWLRPLHGVLNALAWGFCLPLGVILARYLRQIESVGPNWFYAHMAVQGLGFAMGALGFAIGIVLGAASPGVVYGLHRGLGVAAFCAAATQSAAVMFRPAATHRFRRYWKNYHHLVGYGCVVVGVVNVFEGFEVMGIGRGFAKLGYCVVLSTMMGVCAALEANAWVMASRKAEEEKGRKEEMEITGHEMVMKGRVGF